MPRVLDPATRQALAERLRFYREIGITDFYRRPVESVMLAEETLTPDADAGPGFVSSSSAEISPARSSRIFPGEREGEHESQAAASSAEPGFLRKEPATAARKGIPAAPAIGSAVAPADRAAALLQIVEDIGDCTRCALHTGRHSIVFGEGSPNARLMFVGEGPGADEDAQGRPFVGRAGQLLNNMIAAMGLRREDTYICNVVKCRPPGNRTPEPAEANTCSQFLFRQIDVVRPQVIVALGATAATYLLGQRQPLAGLRGRVHAYRGSSLIVTYHPAFLLRDPRQKKEAWADLQIAMKELGLKAPPRARE